MKNKKLYIGLGVLAVAGIGYYMWFKRKDKTIDNSNNSIKKDNESVNNASVKNVNDKPLFNKSILKPTNNVVLAGQGRGDNVVTLTNNPVVLAGQGRGDSTVLAGQGRG